MNKSLARLVSGPCPGVLGGLDSFCLVLSQCSGTIPPAGPQEGVIQNRSQGLLVCFNVYNVCDIETCS